MPTYEYECIKCGAVTEIFQPITEPARRKLRKADPRACRCNATVRRRIGTGGGIIFKGSGFYQTDYRSDGYKNAAKAESSDGAAKKDASTKDASKAKPESTPKPEKKPDKSAPADAE
jgi:putative FmdB family regulatory protein